MSVVCIAHLKKYRKSYLPYGQYLKLSSDDRNKIAAAISQYCGAQELKDTERLFSTNKCENLHSRLFSIAPKSTVWSRNFPGLCHATTLGASIGRGVSLLRIAEHIGLEVCAKDPIYKYAHSIEKAAKYHAKRKQSFRYKSNRYSKRRKIAHKALIDQSMYRTESAASAEHSYGIIP